MALASRKRGWREASCRYGRRSGISWSAPLCLHASFLGTGSRARETSEDHSARIPTCVLHFGSFPTACVSVRSWVQKNKKSPGKVCPVLSRLTSLQLTECVG